MSEPTAERKAAFAHIAERWDAERTERTLEATHKTLQRRKRRARVFAAAAATSLVLTAVAAGWLTLRVPRASAPIANRQTTTAAVSTAADAPTQRLQLADGSEITLLDRDAHVIVKEVSATRMGVELTAGRAHFEIAHRTERVFRVMCGEVAVEVLGTSFDLERDAARTRVAVARGRVAVEWNGGRTELSAGEAGWFPKPIEAPVTATHATKPVAAAASSWREPAEHGDFDHAYTLLAQAKRAPSDDVEELMLAADTARMSGHPEAALPYLNRVVTHHARDARAPLAAFTLGGVLMQQLGRPGEAEAAYAQARALSPDSALAQDALARQVEAAHRAGDALHAAALAREYLQRYPNGRRVNAVRRFGGLL